MLSCGALVPEVERDGLGEPHYADLDKGYDVEPNMMKGQVCEYTGIMDDLVHVYVTH